MYKVKSLFLLVEGFLFLSIACAQELRTQLGDVYYDVNMYKGEYYGTEGSPYLEEAFTPCRINDITETQLVRFNAYNGTVEVKMSTTKIVLLAESENYLITLKDGSGKTYYTKNYFDSKGDLKNSFFELIHESSSFKLYAQEKIKYFKAVKPEAYKDAQPPSFKKAEELYFITDLWEKTPYLIELPTRLNFFLKLFPGQAKSLKKYIKENRFELDDPEDLIEILDKALGSK